MSLSNYKTELEKNGVIGFVPRGNSMWPILKNRGQSVVVIKKTEKLNVYDAALYVRADGTTVLHRVMEQTDFGYVICGDSQFTLENVYEDQVVGVMTGFYKGKKYIDCNDEKYRKRVEKWYKHKTMRKIRLKLFYFWIGIKSKIAGIFKKNRVEKIEEEQK